MHPTGLVDPKEPEAKVKFLAGESICGVGGLLLDNEGQRFVDKFQHGDFVIGKIWENVKYPVLWQVEQGDRVALQVLPQPWTHEEV